jgi:hypothetical protein
MVLETLWEGSTCTSRRVERGSKVGVMSSTSMIELIRKSKREI